MGTEEIVKNLGQFIVNQGGACYLTGGAVRDALMGKTPKDYDLECFLIPEDLLEQHLQSFALRFDLKFSSVGKSFKVFKLGQFIDVSLPRRDKKVGEGHRGFEIVADPYMTIKEAASRRDFSINAIYKEVPYGTLIDLFNGENDIAHRQIRMVDKNAFAEDPLRVLRAVQFASRFGFFIDLETWGEMTKVDLSELPAERIFGEMEKLLMQSEKPSRGLELFGPNPDIISVASYDYIRLFPELSDLVKAPQDPKWHPEGNVFTHTMMVVDAAIQILKIHSELSYPERLTVMLACLTHDFGKVTTTKEDPSKLVFEEVSPGVFTGRPAITAHDHAEAGLPIVESFLDRLNVHTVEGFDIRSTVLSLVKYHLRPPELFRQFGNNPSLTVGNALRRLSTKARMDLLAIVSLADMVGRGVSDEEKLHSKNIIEWFEFGAQQCNVEKSAPEPLLRGRDLIEMGVAPGIGMGVVLKAAYELQLDGGIRSLYQARNWAQTIIRGMKDGKLPQNCN